MNYFSYLTSWVLLLKFWDRAGGQKLRCFGVGERWRKGRVTTIFDDRLLALGAEDVAEEGFDSGIGGFARSTVNVGCDAAGEGVGVFVYGLVRGWKEGAGGWADRNRANVRVLVKQTRVADGIVVGADGVYDA